MLRSACKHSPIVMSIFTTGGINGQYVETGRHKSRGDMQYLAENSNDISNILNLMANYNSNCDFYLLD
jgi:hypothetical protein